MNSKYGIHDYYDDEDYDDMEDEYYEEEYVKPKAKPNTSRGNTTNTKQNTAQNKNDKSKNTSQSTTANKIVSTNTKNTTSTNNNNNKKTADKKDTNKAKNDKLNVNNDYSLNLVKTNSAQSNPTIKANLDISNAVYEIKLDKSMSKETTEKPTLNLIAIGHVDAGKSTLLGHLCVQLGLIPQRQIEKYENECKKIGKTSFHYAWALDENEEERKRGVTIDIAMKNFETDKYYIHLIDAPGHRDFVPNMISGVCQADCAMLIIDSSPNAFESGFFADGQTREHSILAFALGIKQIIVVLNKMETSDWSKERFDFIRTNLSQFLEKIGFEKQNIHFIPVSGLQGINLTKPIPKDIPSWHGQTISLMEQINQLNVPERLNYHPLRFLITEAGKGIVNNKQGLQLTGKVEGGNLLLGKKYAIFPVGELTTIKTINSQLKDKEVVYSGDMADVIIEADEKLSEKVR